MKYSSFPYDFKAKAASIIEYNKLQMRHIQSEIKIHKLLFALFEWQTIS